MNLNKRYYLVEIVCFTSSKERHIVDTSDFLFTLEKVKVKLEGEHAYHCMRDSDRPNLIYKLGKTKDLKKEL